jgi:hypothetical protein
MHNYSLNWAFMFKINLILFRKLARILSNTMSELLIYCDFVTERLIYTTKFICNERDVNFTLCNDPQRFEQQKADAKLVYSDYPFERDYPTIQPAKLVFEETIEIQKIEKRKFEERECLSFSDRADPIASIFYIVSRYEEYLPYPADQHDRFISECSILKKFGWLYEPICDIWAEEILYFVQRAFPQFTFTQPKRGLTLTFDIDNTFAFKHKSIVQLLGGRFKDFLKGNHQNLELRRKVLEGSMPDPNDTFEQILSYHKLGCAIIIFWHLGDFNQYDRNISWTNAVHQRLIQKMAQHVQVGIHPSYSSYLNESIIKQERGRLEHILKKPVFHSRQHFLKIKFPNTFQLLHNITIKHDYSLGFADDVGFRLGTARAIPFFNLQTNETYNLMLHPFTYMDGTFNHYLKLNTAQAKEKIKELASSVKKYGGNFICIWHNDTINNQGSWTGWKEVLDFTIEQFRNQ